MPNESKSPLHRFTVKLEQLSALDAPANLVADRLRAAIPEGPTREALRGDMLGHSLHPMLTDLPIGFWTSAVVLDLLGGKSSHRAADTLLLGGILAYLPAAITGGTDWSEKTAPGPMRRVGLLHAGLNVGALSLFSTSLAHRARGRRGRGRLLSLLGLGVLGGAGYLGGHLSYSGGVGVSNAAPPQAPPPVVGGAAGTTAGFSVVQPPAEPPYAPPLA